MSTRVNIKNLSFDYNKTCDITGNYDLHCHNTYEIYCFLEGDVDYLVEGHKYNPTPGSILLLAPNVFHGVKINQETPYRRYTLHFSPEIFAPERRDFLLSAFPPLTHTSPMKVYYDDIERFHILTILEILKECAEDAPEIQNQRVPICVEGLLSQIVHMCSAEAIAENHSQSDTISRLIQYLNQHLKEDINLDQLSKQFYISKHHLNKVFRKATGTTVLDYLIRKRISMAQHLLTNGYSAHSAAAECGFDDYSSFYRSYVRILGHSPSCDKNHVNISN